MKDISPRSFEKMKDGIPDAILPMSPLPVTFPMFVSRWFSSIGKINRSKELMYMSKNHSGSIT